MTTKPELTCIADLNSVKNKSCSICLDSFKNKNTTVITSCRHVYHDKCIKEWFLTKPTCPYCRTVLFKPKKEEERPIIFYSAYDNVRNIHYTYIAEDEDDGYLTGNYSDDTDEDDVEDGVEGDDFNAAGFEYDLEMVNYDVDIFADILVHMFNNGDVEVF